MDPAYLSKEKDHFVPFFHNSGVDEPVSFVYNGHRVNKEIHSPFSVQQLNSKE